MESRKKSLVADPAAEDASLRRVLDALALRTPDKVPFHAYESPEHAVHLLGRQVHEIYSRPDLLPRAMIHAAGFYDNDIIYMRSGVFVKENLEVSEGEDALLFRDRDTGTLAGRVLFDTRTFIPARPPDPSITDLHDVEKAMPVRPWKVLKESPSMRSLIPYVEAFKGKRFLFGFACSQSANVIDSNLGTEWAMLAVMEDTGLCRAIMERRWEQLRQEILALKDLGADGIYSGDACASCSFFSPTIYRDLFFEYQKRSIDFIHAQGMKALLHICGRINPILEDMVATGADVIESLDSPSSGGDIDLADAKRRVGGRVCLKGNLDAVHEIEPLSPEDVYELALSALRKAGPGGYILSTEQVTRDTPAEHVLAMVRARDDFGTG